MLHLQRILTVFSLCFMATTLHTAQQAVRAQTQVFTLKCDKQHIFILHPEIINIYDLNGNSKELMDDIGTLMDVTFNLENPELIAYDAKNSDKKLVGEAHKTALKLLGSKFVMLCIENGFTKPLEEIVTNNSIDINKVGKSNMSYLNQAIYNNKNDILKLLIKLKADVNLLSKDFASSFPLISAIKCNKGEMIKILLLAGAEIQHTEIYAALNDDEIESEYRENAKTVISEVYNAREAEQGVMRQLVKQRIGTGTSLGKEIIEYLLGKDHKVCAIKKQQT